MKACIISIDRSRPQEEKIRAVSGILASGGLIVMPTETVFGLACDVSNTDALKRLYALKKRPESKPFTVQVADINKLLDYAGAIGPRVDKIMKDFWPGPLTLIIETIRGKEGFRIPDNSTALSVLAAFGRPLAVTSVNTSGERALCGVKDIAESFGHLIDAIIDDGSRAAGVESTVLDCTAAPFKILREGAIADRLKSYISPSS